MTDSLVLDTLAHAIRDRQPASGLVHHSDRGEQYASQAYRAVLRRAEFRQCRPTLRVGARRAANCYDNAFLESCFGTIKTELEMTEYQHSRLARQDIASYLAYHSHDPRHSSRQPLSKLDSPIPIKQLDCPRFARQLRESTA